MGGLTVKVVDAGGSPAAGAKVRLRMTGHAFGFGTAVAAAPLSAEGDDSEKYRRFIRDNFNMVVLENDLKWPQWEQSRGRAQEALAWLRVNGITQVRGHNLVWPGWRWLPTDLHDLKKDPPALRERIRAHIEDVVTATRGQLVDWDVLNEPYSNRDLQSILGEAAMVEWFKTARLHDSSAQLYINDYSILSAGGADHAHQDHYFNTIRSLLDAGAPLDGIGMQGHFSRPTPPDTMLRILDRFAAFGRPIAITEYDFDTRDEQLQARFFRDLLLTVFSHPSVRSFLMWGFWERRHWKPAGAMVRRDWSLKPSYDVWRQMVYKEWWTDAEAITSRDGAATMRGFLGSHLASAVLGDQQGEATVEVGPTPRTVTIRLKPRRP